MAKITPLPSERDLIERARTDPEAFGELYRRHYDPIARYLYRRTGCRHTTEDLLGDVFLDALRGLPRFQWRGIGFRHWLYRIATHAANRWARRRKPVERLDDVAAAPEPESGDVLARLLELKPKHQAVLTLHYVEGLSIDEVAQVLKTRPGTVKSRLARARDALRVRLVGNRS